MRGILEGPGSSVLRSQLFLSQARRDSYASRKIAVELGHSDLDVQQTELFDKASKETLYILGSGSSINDLLPGHFSTISKGCSIGINVWAIHPFVPDVYSFESASQFDGVLGEVEFLEQRLRRPEVLQNRPKFLLLRQKIAAGETQIIRFPDELRDHVYVYGRANLVTRNDRNLIGDLKRAFQLMMRPSFPDNVLLDNGASVIRLITLGLAQGFSKIVLVGVDLDSRPYFWLANNYQNRDPEVERLFPRRSGLPHDTLETLSRPFPTDTVITALAAVSEELFGAKILAGSPSSSLANRLEVFRWEEHEL